MPMANGSTPRPLKPASEARLLDVSVRRLAGHTWPRIAADLGWRSKQAAQQWASDNLARYWAWVEAGGSR